MNKLELRSLDNESASLCEGFITEKEYYETVKDLPFDKTPATDGQPANFYEELWVDINTNLQREEE